MRIAEVRTYRVNVPYQKPLEWASGTRQGTSRILVEVVTDTGIHGYGEVFRLHFSDAVLHQDLIPLVRGEEVHNIERIIAKAYAAGFYHHQRALVAALAGLEMALWDAIGKQAGLPVYRLLGGRFRDGVHVAGYVLNASPEGAAEEAREYVRKGYGTIKVKLGHSQETDLAILRAVRAAIGPDVRLRADVNQAWSIGTAKRILRAAEPLGLEYVEQPLVMTDLHGHRLLRQSCAVPIALDESAYTPNDVLNIIQAEAADVILVDPHQTGGLLAAKKAAAIAEAAGIPVTLHSGGELGLSTAAYLHLAASTPNMLPAIDLQYPLLVRDILTAPPAIEGGMGRPPEKPGLGVEIDWQAVEAMSGMELYSPYDRSGEGSEAIMRTKPAF